MVKIDPKEKKRKTVQRFIKIAHPLTLLEVKVAKPSAENYSLESEE